MHLPGISDIIFISRGETHTFMLVAVLSDIHGNLEALMAVIEDLEPRSPAMVVCLGDLIGYGPDPEETVNIFRQKEYTSILGNHEAALKESRFRNFLNFQAKENNIQTERLMSPENIDYCKALEYNLVLEKGMFVHGFPPDSVLRYFTMVRDKEIAAFFTNFNTDICFVGHTHDLLIANWDGEEVVRSKLQEKKIILEQNRKYMINAGSVGQPRDGNNKAKYLLWDTEMRSVEAVYIPYDYKATARKIEALGFPKAYGARLG